MSYRVPMLAVVFLLSPGLALPDEPEYVERLRESATILRQGLEAGDGGIPHDLLHKAHCAVVVPGLKKGAFVVGGSYGKGYFSCRGKGRKGWTAPGTVRIEGGSFGLQIGGSETDVIMLVMNKSGADRLLSSKFKLGADASVAAGPVGRTTAAETDATMRAEMLTWSRSRGLFAGVALEGSTVREDRGSNRKLYGKRLTNRQIIEGGVEVPAAAKELIAVLTKYSAAEER